MVDNGVANSYGNECLSSIGVKMALQLFMLNVTRILLKLPNYLRVIVCYYLFLMISMLKSEVAYLNLLLNKFYTYF